MGKGEEREKEKRKNFLIHNTVLFNWVYRKRKKNSKKEGPGSAPIFENPWTITHLASLSFTVSQRLPRFISVLCIRIDFL